MKLKYCFLMEDKMSKLYNCYIELKKENKFVIEYCPDERIAVREYKLV